MGDDEIEFTLTVLPDRPEPIVVYLEAAKVVEAMANGEEMTITVSLPGGRTVTVRGRLIAPREVA